MRTISAEELKEILDKHKKWINDEEGGERANLSNADLSNANLSNANLSNANLYNADLYNANLSNANLSNANLYNANLSNANLSNADLRYANLSNANLSNADLRYANLRYADLYNADLRYADLYNADLRYANLSNADLRYADLYNANLSNANLYNANLSNADLSNAKLDEKEKIRCGWLLKEDFHAYKKCREGLIVELIIPKGSIVFSINNSKCRTNRAKVVSITDIEGKVTYDEAVSKQDENFIYKVGAELEVINQSENLEELCDMFVTISRVDEKTIHCINYTLCDDLRNDKGNDGVYGAIWTDKGLIYVAKMNDKGELVLI